MDGPLGGSERRVRGRIGHAGREEGVVPFAAFAALAAVIVAVDSLKQELLAAPGLVLEVPYLDTGLYGRGLQSMHSHLTNALERV